MLGLKPTLTPLEQKHQTEHLVSKYLVTDSSLRSKCCVVTAKLA